ncbi:hypothetical protein GGR52DRAFT_95330 [Hypoxylon sp. FL1284]|nr:hypothetical protein GGR52DRAFT_95330 [Hypoxylon sp. FL1284]
MAQTAAQPSYAAKVYKAVGFTKAYNFWLWASLSLGLGGFTMLRLRFLDLYGGLCGRATGGSDGAVPGECFYYLQPGRYQLGIMVHLACVLPASLMALAQFVPAFRRRALGAHRVNGYVATALAVPATLSTLVIARRAMGGGLDTQSMVGLLAIIFLYANFRGISSARRHQVEQHRAWMLRAWVNAGAIVTMRVIITLSVMFMSYSGGYYYVQPCAKLEHMLEGRNATLTQYPECAPFFSGEDPDRHVAVRATVFTDSLVEKGSMINLVFGTSGWLAIFIHVIGTEIYLYYTSTERKTAKSVKIQQKGVNGALKAE